VAFIISLSLGNDICDTEHVTPPRHWRGGDRVVTGCGRGGDRPEIKRSPQAFFRYIPRYSMCPSQSVREALHNLPRGPYQKNFRQSSEFLVARSLFHRADRLTNAPIKSPRHLTRRNAATY
ncbi:MAG: hypothetical protein U1D06_13340, partial [Paracoccaceae bacterium]|nr:hypothetical protein [Paracoccaceae bacterium]